jgi:hypothetical protein
MLSALPPLCQVTFPNPPPLPMPGDLSALGPGYLWGLPRYPPRRPTGPESPDPHPNPNPTGPESPTLNRACFEPPIPPAAASPHPNRLGCPQWHDGGGPGGQLVSRLKLGSTPQARPWASREHSPGPAMGIGRGAMWRGAFHFYQS